MAALSEVIISIDAVLDGTKTYYAPEMSLALVMMVIFCKVQAPMDHLTALTCYWYLQVLTGLSRLV
jgi:hypothetical protein